MLEWSLAALGGPRGGRSGDRRPPAGHTEADATAGWIASSVGGGARARESVASGPRARRHGARGRFTTRPGRWSPRSCSTLLSSSCRALPTRTGVIAAAPAHRHRQARAGRARRTRRQPRAARALWAAQTPQAFRRRRFARRSPPAGGRGRRGDRRGDADRVGRGHASLIEPAPAANLKVTTPDGPARWPSCSLCGERLAAQQHPDERRRRSRSGRRRARCRSWRRRTQRRARCDAANATSMIARSVSDRGARGESVARSRPQYPPEHVLTDYHVHLREDGDTAPGRARRPSRRPTPTATSRPPREAGIEELGCSEHIHRFKQASTSGRHPFWEEQAATTSTPTATSCDSTPLRLGIETDFVPGAEDRTASLLDARELRLRARLRPLRRRSRRRPRRLRRLGAERRPGRRLAPLLRDGRPRRRGRVSSTSSPTLTW